MTEVLRSNIANIKNCRNKGMNVGKLVQLSYLCTWSKLDVVNEMKRELERQTKTTTNRDNITVTA